MRLLALIASAMIAVAISLSCGAATPDTPTPAPTPIPTATMAASPTIAPQTAAAAVPHRGYNVRGSEDAPITLFDFSDFQ